jgi:hypothetical protein
MMRNIELRPLRRGGQVVGFQLIVDGDFVRRTLGRDALQYLKERQGWPVLQIVLTETGAPAGRADG